MFPTTPVPTPIPGRPFVKSQPQSNDANNEPTGQSHASRGSAAGTTPVWSSQNRQASLWRMKGIKQDSSIEFEKTLVPSSCDVVELFWKEFIKHNRKADS